MVCNLFQTTKTNTRNYPVAILVGFLGGIISAFVKTGIEDLLPPRLPKEIPPPIEMLQEMGVNLNSLVYTYSEHIISWGGNSVHILFSIFIAIFYCFFAEIFPKIKLAQGTLFAVIFAFICHGIILPLFNWTPALWDLSIDGILSELVGTIIWMWTIEIFRRDLRNRITKKLDPEFQ